MKRAVEISALPAGGARVLSPTKRCTVRTTWIQAALFGGMLAVGGCATHARSPAAGAEAEIVRILEASAERWNQGDLDGFLEPYLDAPSTTFVSGGGLIRGRDAIEARYRSSYWSEGIPREQLRFAALEVRPLGADHALVTGLYRLYDGAGTQTGEGPFSLVLARTPGGWKIVHDHSS